MINAPLTRYTKEQRKLIEETIKTLPLPDGYYWRIGEYTTSIAGTNDTGTYVSSWPRICVKGIKHPSSEHLEERFAHLYYMCLLDGYFE